MSAGRICVLCRLAVPTRVIHDPYRAPGLPPLQPAVDELRSEHARICAGSPPPEAVVDALVAADAFVEGVSPAPDDFAHPAHPQVLAQIREIARAMYEQKFKLALPDAKGWYALRTGSSIEWRRICTYCRVEIVSIIDGKPESIAVAERLSDRHATLCALHVVGGLREPVLELPRNPNPERPDFK